MGLEVRSSVRPSYWTTNCGPVCALCNFTYVWHTLVLTRACIGHSWTQHRGYFNPVALALFILRVLIPMTEPENVCLDLPSTHSLLHCAVILEPDTKVASISLPWLCYSLEPYTEVAFVFALALLILRVLISMRAWKCVTLASLSWCYLFPGRVIAILSPRRVVSTITLPWTCLLLVSV